MRLLQRFTQHKPEGRVIHIPGLFYRYDNARRECGHIRLFGKPLGGIMIHHWNSEFPIGWASTRWWGCPLFAVIHVNAGPNNERQSINRPGWHFRFAKIEFKKIYSGFSISFKAAERGYAF